MIVQNYLGTKIKATRVYKHLVAFVPSVISLHDYIFFPVEWKQDNSHFEIQSELVALVFCWCGSITNDFFFC